VGAADGGGSGGMRGLLALLNSGWLSSGLQTGDNSAPACINHHHYHDASNHATSTGTHVCTCISILLPQSYLHICCSKPREIKLSHPRSFLRLVTHLSPRCLSCIRVKLRDVTSNSYDSSVLACCASLYSLVVVRNQWRLEQ
jgi:hypothetical protein